MVFAVDSIPAILAYVGIKMLLSHHLQIPIIASLVVIALSIAAGITFSLTHGRKNEKESPNA